MQTHPTPHFPPPPERLLSMMVDGLQTLARKAHAKREPQLSPPSHSTAAHPMFTRLKMPVLLAVRASQMHFSKPADRDFISSRVTCSRYDLDAVLLLLEETGYLFEDNDHYTLTRIGVDACMTSTERRAA